MHKQSVCLTVKPTEHKLIKRTNVNLNTDQEMTSIVRPVGQVKCNVLAILFSTRKYISQKLIKHIDIFFPHVFIHENKKMLCFHAFYDILIFKSEFRLMVSSIWSYKRNSNVGISFTAVGNPAFSRVKDM